MELTRLFKVLAEHGVESVLVGAMAAQVQRAPTQTQDVDICYSPTRENKARIVAALIPYNPRLRKADLGSAENASLPPLVWDSRTLVDIPNITLRTSLGNVDLLTRVDGIGDYADVMANATSIEVAPGLSIACLDLRAIIVSKEFCNRPKDRAQLPILRATLERNIRGLEPLDAPIDADPTRMKTLAEVDRQRQLEEIVRMRRARGQRAGPRQGPGQRGRPGDVTGL